MSAASPSPAPRPDPAPCACGSGLRARRCCALDGGGPPDPAHHALVAPQVEQARAARTAGRNREAERLLLQVLDLAPLHREALRLLYEIRHAERRIPAAIALVARIAALPPETPAAHVQHAQLLIGQGRHAEAEAPARRALLLAPRDPSVHHLLGMIQTETGRPTSGERHYRMAEALIEAPNPTLLGNLAWNLRQQGRLDEAAAVYGQALSGPARPVRALAGLAQVEAGRGRFDAAEALLAEAGTSAAAPGDRMVAALIALSRLRAGDAEAALDRIAATEAAIAPQPLLTTELAMRGRALERLGRHDEAWAAYLAGRDFQRERARRRFDPAPIEARLAGIRETFRADRLAGLPRPAPVANAPVPVFLLGTPRSGSSLLEHLLAQAAEIDPADNRAPLPGLGRLLPRLVEGFGGPTLDFPAALEGTVAGEAQDIPAILASRYVALIRAAGIVGPQARFVTDRHPELPWLLGLANTLFPGAPVIHVLRHPLDVVLSGFAQDRLYEGNAGVTLASLARLYDAQMNAIAHVRGQTTMRYLPVRYEDLVTDTEATLRRVLDFIGLAADPAAMIAAPPRAVPRVPAYRAELEPPHRRGVFRHRRFGDVFGEAMPVLAPWIERLGYAATPEGAA
ncbi:tetratricopeptide repeat-containing sulfotransferase family protein [Acidiphilium cryptum]|uniref:Sulfotransferase n=1 Tax=Acidiphilium cryptum (strain JF-5) TaxID=349163 RepID=A5FV54_ACICJ|nr:tetratricopeptide repeat-containing sulfotransferase family protein [Acidiphilium cryptum]ABQ29486.1 sulfotransferase [Acidiphilium cryptum JF-5]